MHHVQTTHSHCNHPHHLAIYYTLTLLDTPLPTTRAPHSAVLPAGSQYADARKLPASPTQLRAVLVSRRFITVSWQRPEDTQVTDTITYAVYWREQGSER